MNILDFTKSVNSFLKNPQQTKQHIFEVASEIFYLESPMKENFVECASQLGYEYHKVFIPDCQIKQDKCSKDIPFIMADNPKQSDKKSRHNTAKAVLFPEAFENSSHIKLFKTALRVTLERFIARWGVTGIKQDDLISFFISNAKGTKRYFKKAYWRFHDVCSELDKHYKYHFFDTVTCDPSKFKSDLILRYRQFADKISEYCRYMSRFIDGKCVAVIESTASGLPHAHIVYYTNNPFSDCKERHKKGTKYNYIYDGILKQKSLDWWSEGYCELRRDQKNDTANYLSKYLSKVSETDLRELLKKKHWNKTDLKMVLTVLLSVLAAVRQFRLPQLKNLPEDSVQAEIATEFCETTETPPKDESSPSSESDLEKSARLRAYLKALCTKSPIPCICRVVMAQYKDFTSKYGEDFDKINESPEVEKKKIFESLRQVTCQGCVFSRLLESIVYDKPICYEEVDNSILFESFAFRKWIGFYQSTGYGKAWAKNEQSQNAFIKGLVKNIAHSCGGSVASGSLEIMLSCHNALWASYLPKEVFSFATDLFRFQIENLHQTEDSLKVYNKFQKTFRKFILTISASGIIFTE